MIHAIARDSAVRRSLVPVATLTKRAVAALGWLTRRDEDLERDDRTAEAVFQESRIGRVLAAATDACARAWAHSAVGSCARKAWSDVRSVGLMDRIRAACWIAVAAAVTALALRRVSPRVEPLTWIIPAAVAVVAVLVMVATLGARRDTRA